LSFSEIKSFPVPIIPVEKQVEIVNQIKEIEIDINLAISKAQKEISSIKEYREALITDLVTGKRSVDNMYSASNNGFAVAAESDVAYGNDKGFSNSFNNINNNEVNKP